MLATSTSTAPSYTFTSTPTLPCLVLPRKNPAHSLRRRDLPRLPSAQQDRRIVGVSALALQSPLQHAAHDVSGDSVFYGPARHGDAIPVELRADLFQSFQCHAVARILID
jgi:hypothetical protein